MSITTLAAGHHRAIFTSSPWCKNMKHRPGCLDSIFTSGNCSAVTFCLSAVTCSDIGLSAVHHGRWRLIYGSHNQFNAAMMLTCDPGYYYRGQRVIRCQDNGTWNYPNPRPSCNSEYTQSASYCLVCNSKLTQSASHWLVCISEYTQLLVGWVLTVNYSQLLICCSEYTQSAM